MSPDTDPGNETDTKFATVVLAGKPNAGKSTLLNALVGQKLAITSGKPQSTRYVVSGIVTEHNCQLVFIDPPGLFDPANLLQRSMVESAIEAANRADMVLYLHPMDERYFRNIEDLIPDLVVGQRPIVTVLTKCDIVAESDPPTVAEVTLVVSAKTGQGLEELKTWCRDNAPQGAFRHDSENLSTQNLRFFAAEMVREAAFEVLEQELPYAVAAEVDQFREEPKPVYIRVVIHVDLHHLVA